MATTKSIYIKQSRHCHKNCKFFFVFLYESYFLLGHFYFKCNLKNP